MTESNIRLKVPIIETSTDSEIITIDRLRTIVQDSHLNFLIGAGTSSLYFEPLGEIEEALTQIGESGVDKTEACIAQAAIKGYFFKKSLAPNTQLLERSDEAKDLIKSYAQFMSIINRILVRRKSTLLSKQANIFTTNVDMAFEVALELLEIDMNDGFLGRFRPRLDLGEFGTLRVRQGSHYGYQSAIPVINLFKLHGSAAWQEEGDDIYFDHQLIQIANTLKAYKAAEKDLIEIRSSNDVNATTLLSIAKGKTLSGKVVDFIKEYDNLSIVNPEKTKFATTVLNKTYYELIRRFANQLEVENSTLFVHGFSFRDEHIRDLVLRAARSNPTLLVVIFCYTDTDRDMMQKLLSAEKIKNGNIIFITPKGVRGDEAERKISLDVLVEDFLAPLLAESHVGIDRVIELKLNGSSELTLNG